MRHFVVPPSGARERTRKSRKVRRKSRLSAGNAHKHPLRISRGRKSGFIGFICQRFEKVEKGFHTDDKIFHQLYFASPPTPSGFVMMSQSLFIWHRLVCSQKKIKSYALEFSAINLSGLLNNSESKWIQTQVK